MVYILGISAFYHDSAAALIKDGEIIAAVQEERFTRIKHDPSFPTQSLKYILSSHNLKISKISKVVFYDKLDRENEVIADYGILFNDTKLVNSFCCFL